jgi:hypothetical protein
VSILALLVLLLLVLVGALVVGGLAYLVHRHPALLGPISITVTATGVLGGLVAVAAQSGTSEAVPAPMTAPARRLTCRGRAPRRAARLRAACRCRVPPAGAGVVWDCRSGSVVVAEVAAQLTRGFDLCEKLLGLDRDALDGVGAGDEAQRRLVLAGKGQQGMGELGGVAGLLSVMLFQASTAAVVPSA